MSDPVAGEGVKPVKVGDTFRHPYNKDTNWRPKCHVRAIVDEDMIVVRWFGRHKQWWHYEVLHVSELKMQPQAEGN